MTTKTITTYTATATTTDRNGNCVNANCFEDGMWSYETTDKTEMDREIAAALACDPNANITVEETETVLTGYRIVEEGTEFATIFAESAEEALEIAEETYPRRRSDYNMEPGDAAYEVKWYAWSTEDGDDHDTLLVSVPSEGLTDAELVAAFESHGAAEGENDYIVRRCSVDCGADKPSWVTGRDVDDADGVELADVLAGMDADDLRRAAAGAEDAYLTSVGRPTPPALKGGEVSGAEVWDVEIEGVTLGARWSAAFIAAWSAAAKVGAS